MSQRFELFHRLTMQASFLRELAPAMVRRSEFQKVADVFATSLEEVFERTNHLDQPWWQHPSVLPTRQPPTFRSTSEGDVVADETGCLWLVQGVGFAQITWEEEPLGLSQLCRLLTYWVGNRIAACDWPFDRATALLGYQGRFLGLVPVALYRGNPLPTCEQALEQWMRCAVSVQGLDYPQWLEQEGLFDDHDAWISFQENQRLLKGLELLLSADFERFVEAIQR